MTEYHHVAYNPYLGTDVLQRVCAEQEKDGWRLLRVVPHHQYELVAVFERDVSPVSGQSATEPIIVTRFLDGTCTPV